MCRSPELGNTIPGSLEPDSRDPGTETGNLETEKRVHRIHGTLTTGLQKDALQAVPPQGGPADFCYKQPMSRDPLWFTEVCLVNRGNLFWVLA